MSRGAHVIGLWPDQTPVAGDEAPIALSSPDLDAGEPIALDDIDAPRDWRGSLSVSLALSAATSWLIFFAFVEQSRWMSHTPSPEQIAIGIAMICPPLAVIGLIYTLMTRGSRREAVRFARLSSDMRGEQARLEAVLTRVGHQLDKERGHIADSSAALSRLGDDAALRIKSVNSALHGEAATISRYTDHLKRAAAGARADIAVLLADLPKAQVQAQSMVSALDGAGKTVLDRATEMDARLAALESHGRNADLVADGAAKKLAEILSRIETLSASASMQLGDASARSTAALNDALDRVATANEAARAGFDAQAQMITALADQSLAAVTTTGAEAAEALRARISDAASQHDLMATRLSDQGAATHAMLEHLTEGFGAAATALTDSHGHAEALITTMEAAKTNAQALADGAGAQLAAALSQVREAADEAAQAARAAIAYVIPASVAQLSEASREALGKAITEQIETHIASLGVAAERAVAAAHDASDRLMRQMLTIAETSAAVEARIEDARTEAETHDGDNFARRVALLIESLNSTAIDVTKILSNDVTDSAWAAYLRGDRGIFTRRAVRLLDASETRAIQRHYDSDGEFRAQVNRYVHDFEAMLRNVLATRDGAALSVTLLSSDMGKLYVALAQAIERLRS